MRRLTCLIAVLVVTSAALVAQGSSTGSSELKIPLNARAAALGDATVSDGGQLSSWLLNPANLYANGPLAVSLSHSQWIQEVQSEFLGAQIPLSFGSLGLAISTNSVPGIEIRETPGPPLGTFSARFAAIQIGFAARPIENVAVGASVKYLYEKLYADDATGFGIDAGVVYHTPVEGLQAGVSVTNAGTLQQFRNERSNLPTFMRAGATYAFELPEFNLSASLAATNNLQYAEHHILGSVEATYDRFISLRAGYATGYDARGLSAGFGVKYQFVQFDYAFIPFSLGLGDGHLFTLGFQF